MVNKNNAALATVSGFTLDGHGLTPIPGSTRFLNAGATDAGQVRFSPDGKTLVVTGRSTNRIDTFLVGKDGTLSGLKTFDVAPGGTPFGFDFDKKGHAARLARRRRRLERRSVLRHREGRLALDDHRTDRDRPERRLLARHVEGRPLRLRRERRELVRLHVRRLAEG